MFQGLLNDTKFSYKDKWRQRAQDEWGCLFWLFFNDLMLSASPTRSWILSQNCTESNPVFIFYTQFISIPPRPPASSLFSPFLSSLSLQCFGCCPVAMQRPQQWPLSVTAHRCLGNAYLIVARFDNGNTSSCPPLWNLWLTQTTHQALPSSDSAASIFQCPAELRGMILLQKVVVLRGNYFICLS